MFRPAAILAAAVAVCAATPAPAFALAPSHANITFATGSTVTPTASRLTASSVLVWSPGASDISGVGCCTSTVSDGITDLVEGTTAHRLPFTWNSDDPKRLEVDSYDDDGNYVGTAFTNAPSFVSMFGVVPDDEATYTGAWATRTVAGALGGSLHSSTAKGASVTFSASLRTLAWVTTVGPTHGSARVYVDGKLVATVSTHAAHVGYRRIMFSRAWWGGPNDPTHSIRIVNAGTSGHSRVDVDGFATVTED
jgi:hypothetical protein